MKSNRFVSQMENGMNYLWFHHQNKMQGGVDGRYGRMTATTSSNNVFDDFVDPELNDKTYKVAEKVSENLNIIANDASLAFFRIQEHVRKTLPQLVDQKHEVQDIHKKVQGAGFDAEYATNAVKTMNGSATHFQNIQDLLKNAMFMKQQIDYEENRSQEVDIPVTEGGNASQTNFNQSAGTTSSPSRRPRVVSTSYVYSING